MSNVTILSFGGVNIFAFVVTTIEKLNFRFDFHESLPVFCRNLLERLPLSQAPRFETKFNHATLGKAIGVNRSQYLFGNTVSGLYGKGGSSSIYGTSGVDTAYTNNRNESFKTRSIGIHYMKTEYVPGIRVLATFLPLQINTAFAIEETGSPSKVSNVFIHNTNTITGAGVMSNRVEV